MFTFPIDFDAIEWQTSESGARSKIAMLESGQMRLLEFGRDLEHPQWCESGHVGYVLEGELEIEFADGTWTLKAGDGVSIADGSDHKHRPRAISDMVRLLFFEKTTL